jgi:hypothetical protein
VICSALGTRVKSCPNSVRVRTIRHRVGVGTLSVKIGEETERESVDLHLGSGRERRGPKDQEIFW